MAEGQIEQLLRSAVGNGVAPGVAFAITGVDRPTQAWYAGNHTHLPGRERPIAPDSVFDLASLTKPFTTMTWALRLVERGALDLYAKVGDYLDAAGPVGEVPVWRLMNHTSGLPAHREYFRGLGGAVRTTQRFERARAAIRRMVLQSPVSPAGEQCVYSDLGFMALSWVCEAAEGATLDVTWSDLPGHGPAQLRFRPLPTEGDPDYVATEESAWRGGLMRGEVHDDNCWTMGGVAGHAGLFGRLEDAVQMARTWLQALRGAGDLGVSAATVADALDARWCHPRGTYVLGWDTPTPGFSTSGRHFGRRAFGHLGFTGTSVWIDPEADVAMVLLTNRVCPTRQNDRIREFRPVIHDAAWEALVG